jgi:hypothetical protein
LGQFITFYDWIPLESENIDNIYFSFDKDGIDYLQQQIYTPLSLNLIGKQNTNIVDIGRIGIKMNKNLIDPAFTDLMYMYSIKRNYKANVEILTSSIGHFVCYLQNPNATPISIDITILND